MRAAFTAYFVLLALPSMAFIVYLAMRVLFGVGGAILRDVTDAEAFSLLLFPGAFLVLGLGAVGLLARAAIAYARSGAEGLAGRLGQLIATFFMALPPLIFTLPLGTVTVLREMDPEILLMAAFGSGLLPLIALVWLFVLALATVRTRAHQTPGGRASGGVSS